MISKILVPIDFSTTSKYATDLAVSLARLFGSDLVYYFVDEQKTKNETIKEHVERFLKQFDTNGLTTEKVFKKGDFVPSAIDYIKVHDIDLVVIGSHGVSGVDDIFLGSNALKLMRKTPCPLIVVKDKVTDFALNKIVFASNFDNSNFGPFRSLIQLIQPFNAEIHLLNIDTPGFFSDGNTIVQPALNSFKEYAEEKGFICKTYRKSSRVVEEGIHAFIQELKPDLIVIPTSDKSALRRLFVSSIAEAVINHVDIPAMTMRM